MTSPIPFHTHRSRLAAVIAILVMICCAPLSSLAEAPGSAQPTSSPQTAAQQTPNLKSGSTGSFAYQVAKFGTQAGELIKVLQTEMMRLMDWVEYLALVLMMVVIVGSGVREWHENNWEGRNLFWWFGRLAVCMLLFGSSAGIIDELYLAGKELAEGQNRDSLLYRFYTDREELFNASYDKVVDGSFKVTVRGQEFKVEPIDGAEAFLGVTKDGENTIRDLSSNLDDPSYTLPRLFAILSIARGVMDLGDVWLVVLAGLLVMTFKVTAPFMVVLAIDRKLSQRTVNAYIWGLIVLTLIWPSVSYFIRGLAYMAGNLAMSMGDQGQVFSFAEETQKALRSPDTQPVYTIGFGALMMLGSGLALWVSPFLAYSFSMGRVFEGVSQTASQYAASFVGAALEWVSANTAARISRQAEKVQVEGANQAEQERARGEKKFGDIQNQARLAQAVQGARSQQITSLSQIHAGLISQVGLANAGRDFQNAALHNQNMLTWRNMLTGREKEIADNNVGLTQQLAELKAGWRSSGLENNGRTLSGATPPLFDPFGGRGTNPANVPGGTNPATGSPGGIKGFVSRMDPLGAAGFSAGVAMQTYGNWLGWQLREEAVQAGVKGRNDNIWGYYGDMQTNLRAYTRDMYGANADYATAQSKVAGASAAEASRGANDAYKLNLNTAHRVYDLETEANQVRFDAQIKAADATRKAGMDAANLRVMQHVISQVAGKVTRDIEKAIEMRF